jgi:fatty-acyl-CoA synthase
MKLTPGLERRSANHHPLTPVKFLWRSAAMYPDNVAVIERDRRFTYGHLERFTRQMAGMLTGMGIVKGDVVSVMAPSSITLLAAHFAVPMIGAVLNTLNVRLDAESIAYILDHAESKVLIADAEYRGLLERVLRLTATPCTVLWLNDATGRSEESFETLLSGAEPAVAECIDDEWQPICVNYTSGTTGQPKGVVYHHRGAFLNSVGNVMSLNFSRRTVYLWVVPMFHCNGWMHAWAVTCAGGTHVCLDRVDPKEILRTLTEQQVTHLACAPVVLYMLINHPDFALFKRTHPIKVATGGASPTAHLIECLEAAGFELIHLYGLTESYGPATLCATPDEMQGASAQLKAEYLARQGLPHATANDIKVVDTGGNEVPWDGATLGEICLSGNTLMAGYYRDDAATERAFAGGWFHTGDLAVRHPNGQLEIRDRAKDIIISGGENISSLEIESVLQRHPSVLLAAVVPMKHEKWGEVPCAFIELKDGAAQVPEAELRAFSREHLAHFKVPQRFVYAEIPKTASGKIQKYLLRNRLS